MSSRLRRSPPPLSLSRPQDEGAGLQPHRRPGGGPGRRVDVQGPGCGGREEGRGRGLAGLTQASRLPSRRCLTGPALPMPITPLPPPPPTHTHAYETQGTHAHTRTAHKNTTCARARPSTHAYSPQYNTDRRDLHRDLHRLLLPHPSDRRRPGPCRPAWREGEGEGERDEEMGRGGERGALILSLSIPFFLPPSPLLSYPPPPLSLSRRSRGRSRPTGPTPTTRAGPSSTAPSPS